MDAFLNTPEPNIDQKCYQTEEQHKVLFGHTVLRAMLSDSVSMDSVKYAMKTWYKKQERKSI